MEYEIKSLPMDGRQIEKYLGKLGMDGAMDADLETLSKLQHHHLLRIPYENFDSLQGRITSLAHEELFHKIIEKDRGGICFELNGLYAWLLTSLGYQLKNHAARIITRAEEYQMRRHRVMTVILEGRRYFTDVGVNSERPRIPLLLEEDIVQSDGISEYRFQKDPFWGWVLWQKPSGREWRRALGFTEEPQMDLDFIMPCIFCDLHPLSPINQYPKISIFTEDSNLRIWDSTFTRYCGGRVVEERPLDQEEMDQILWECFRIRLDRKGPAD